jgi:hypothetical protein
VPPAQESDAGASPFPFLKSVVLAVGDIKIRCWPYKDPCSTSS